MQPAVTVVDDWQGKGVGTALLELPAARARRGCRFRPVRLMANALERFGPVVGDGLAAIAPGAL